MSFDEKHDVKTSSPTVSSASPDVEVGTVEPLKGKEKSSESEVFGGTGEGQVNFRTVGWIRASMFLMKQTFATGVLSMPSAMYSLGAVWSAFFIVFWGLINTR